MLPGPVAVLRESTSKEMGDRNVMGKGQEKTERAKREKTRNGEGRRDPYFSASSFTLAGNLI